MSRNPANGRVDQSAAETDARGYPRSDARDPGRPTAWGDPPVTTHPGRSPDHARHQRGVATVNAESGCLKGVDTARNVDEFVIIRGALKPGRKFGV